MKMLIKWWPELLFLCLTIGGIVFLLFGVEAIIALTPLYLLINLGFLVYRFGTQRKVLEMLGIAAVVGFLAELIGVQTGVLFGDYIYGTVLSLKLFDVPLMVGIMWALVMLVVWSLFPKSLGLKRIPLAGIAAVAYDIVLEHFATRYDLWNWSGSIPISNFVGWFLVASLIATIFHFRDYRLEKTKLAMATFPLHTLFFLAAIA